jgi:2-polyprenyl-6-methoxyphenol hydroxylase-like FAD-dependent oxidoreductase
VSAVSLHLRPLNTMSISTTNPPRKILICGGGIAGPVLAYWLARIPGNPALSITILERSALARATGQGLDIRGPGVEIFQRMGLEDEIRAKVTPERGFQKIGASGRVVATFDQTGDTTRQGPTSEFELLRSDLARIFVDAATRRPGVNVVYGDYVKAITQPADGSGKAHVEFVNGKLPASDYDLVVAADGMLSRTRALATGHPAKDDLRSLGTWIAYFRIPRTSNYSATHARIYNAPGRRTVWTRPRPDGATSIYFTIVRPGDAALEAAVGQGVPAQKAIFASLFADAGWETPGIIAAMPDAEDFYFQKVAQTRCDRWSLGRVVLVGDAAYCPSPFSGMGTTLAIYGAYILAGELQQALRGEVDMSAALENYDRQARPWVEQIQKLPPGVPGLFHPSSSVGVFLLNTAVEAAYWSGLPRLLEMLPLTAPENVSLPTYNWAEA